MTKLVDRAQMTVLSAPGTGQISLGAATGGMQTFSAAGIVNGDQVSYVIEDGAAWEVGIGTYVAGGARLNRTTIRASSNGGARIDATVAAVVLVAPSAADFVDATGAAGVAEAAAVTATAAAAAAATSQSSLAAALQQFKKTELGEFTTDPTLDGNGDALVVGAEYFNTVTHKLRVVTSTAPLTWVDQDADAQAARTNAALSATNAATSATAAATSATAAAADRVQTGLDRTATATSATNAATSATAAATSATAAAADRVQTGLDRTATTTSATNAATSATAAATSATAAAADRVQTGLDRTATTTSAAAAATSATAAADSAAVIGSAVRYDTAQSLTAAQRLQIRQNAAAASVEAASELGLVVNPFLEISQENGTSAVALTSGTPKYTIDQFVGSMVGSTMGVSLQQVVNPFSATAGFRRFQSGLQISVTAAQAALSAGYFCNVSTPIEGLLSRTLGWGTGDAVALDIVAIVSASVAGTYSLYVQNAAGNRSYVTSFALAAATPTVVFATIPGDTSGTWPSDTGTGLIIGINVARGATFTTPGNNAWQAGSYTGATGGPLNMTATLGATLTIGYLGAFPSGVLPYTAASQVDLTRLANMRREYPDELRRCKRYWQKSVLSASSYSVPSDSFFSTIVLPVDMRVNPTMSYSGGTFGGTSSLAMLATSVRSVTAEVTADGSATGRRFILNAAVVANARL